MRCLAPAINDPFGKRFGVSRLDSLISILVFAAGGRDCDICIYDERQKRTTVVAMKNRGLNRSYKNRSLY